MAVITISRGSASGGRLLAEGLAQRLGYRIVSREDVVREATRYGVADEELQDALLKPPRFWERFAHTRRRYLTFVQCTLCEQVWGDEGTIYHGNAGHLLLSGVGHVMSVRLIAPLEFRVRMLRERDGMGRQEALKFIESVDRQRQLWSRFLYDVDSYDPNLYDLLINLRTMQVDSAIEVVATSVQRPEFAVTQESRQALADLLLASRVRAALAAHADTASVQVDVRAHRGTVSLKGRLASPAVVDAVLRIVSSVEGVEKIDRDPLDATPPLV